LIAIAFIFTVRRLDPAHRALARSAADTDTVAAEDEVDAAARVNEPPA